MRSVKCFLMINVYVITTYGIVYRLTGKLAKNSIRVYLQFSDNQHLFFQWLSCVTWNLLPILHTLINQIFFSLYLYFFFKLIFVYLYLQLWCFFILSPPFFPTLLLPLFLPFFPEFQHSDNLFSYTVCC